MARSQKWSTESPFSTAHLETTKDIITKRGGALSGRPGHSCTIMQSFTPIGVTPSPRYLFPDIKNTLTSDLISDKTHTSVAFAGKKNIVTKLQTVTEAPERLTITITSYHRSEVRMTERHEYSVLFWKKVAVLREYRGAKGAEGWSAFGTIFLAQLLRETEPVRY